jgi:hypothetical protein
MKSKKMKKLTIQWQRLVNETGNTCPRYSDTDDAVEAVFKKLE